MPPLRGLLTIFRQRAATERRDVDRPIQEWTAETGCQEALDVLARATVFWEVLVPVVPTEDVTDAPAEVVVPTVASEWR